MFSAAANHKPEPENRNPKHTTTLEALKRKHIHKALYGAASIVLATIRRYQDGRESVLSKDERLRSLLGRYPSIWGGGGNPVGSGPIPVVPGVMLLVTTSSILTLPGL